MSWTAPRTWAAGETLTAALLNTHLRDNLKAIGDAWTDYTPTLTAETGTLGAGYTLTSCRYRVVGKTVDFHLNVTITATGCGGYVRTTLPVAAAYLAVGTGRENGVTGDQLQLWVNGSTADIRRYNQGAAATENYQLVVNATYQVA